MTKTNQTYASRKEAAFQAGLQAFKTGRTLADCPIRKHQGLARSWKEGWLAGSTERQKLSSGMFIARAAPEPTPLPMASLDEPKAAIG